jgi:hypothetical protein
LPELARDRQTSPPLHEVLSLRGLLRLGCRLHDLILPRMLADSYEQPAHSSDGTTGRFMVPRRQSFLLPGAGLTATTSCPCVPWRAQFKTRERCGCRVRRWRYRLPLPSELDVKVFLHPAQAFTNVPCGTRPLQSVVLARGSADDSWRGVRPCCPPSRNRLGCANCDGGSDSLPQLSVAVDRRPNIVPFVDTPHRSPPRSSATRPELCLPSTCVLPRPASFGRLAGSAFGFGGVHPLQSRSRARTKNRTSVRRLRHLYRTFSKKRIIRLVRSTWLLVRTRRFAGLFR